jgi:hypothetical protein
MADEKASDTIYSCRPIRLTRMNGSPFWVFWTWPVAVEVLERRASGLDDGCRNVAQLPIAALG